MPEIDERYRALTESVRLQAAERIRELDAAYQALRSKHGVTQVPQRSVFNEPNLPLHRLYRPVPSPETAALWYQAGIQPILIRLDHATGVSLATPTIHGDDSRALFLADSGQWHVARGAHALTDLVAGLPEHDLMGLSTWRSLAASLKPENVIVREAFMYDFPAMLENLSEVVVKWRPALLTPIYDLCYELSIALEIDEVREALAPGSVLYQLYLLTKELGATPFPRPIIVSNIERFDMLDVFDAWSQICDVIGEHVVWHS